jgi:hypothetical protein
MQDVPEEQKLPEEGKAIGLYNDFVMLIPGLIAFI